MTTAPVEHITNRQYVPPPVDGKYRLTWAHVTAATEALTLRQRPRFRSKVYGIPTGGAPVAVMVANLLDLPLADEPDETTLIVDDLVDTGNTFNQYGFHPDQFDALYRKPWSPPTLAPNAVAVSDWLVFPWEHHTGTPTDAWQRIIQHTGEDPTRPGLVDTPTRAAKAFTELTAGYTENPADHLDVVFPTDNRHPAAVTVDDIEFTSLCEHHLLPFTGSVTITYQPNPDVGIVGLSKLQRLVDGYARRLQVQERLTAQLLTAIVDKLDPYLASVEITAHHTCMSMRGAKGSRATQTQTRLEYHHIDGPGLADINPNT